MPVSKEAQITNYLNRGIIEANIEFAKTHFSPLSIVKFHYEVDVEDGFFFKDLISYIHSFSDFNSILQQPNDTFIIFLKDCKLHQAKSIVNQLVRKVKSQFGIDITKIGITLLDSEDDYKSLLDRLDKYYIMSKLSSRRKIFYGTKDFDFYESQNDKQVLNKIFKKLSEIKLYNFYQGLPITEVVKIANFADGIIQVSLDPIKIPFYQNEEFTFIQHDLIPVIIKAKIIKAEPARSLMVLGKLEFLDSSPVERSGIRVEPEKEIYASLAKDSKKVTEGSIISLSENSVVLHVKPDNITKLLEKPLWDTELTLQFQIPTQKSFLTVIKTKAYIYSIVNEKIVLNISPNTLIKSKLRNYISLRQGDLIVNLKNVIRRYSN
jgi:hypothetical protein